MAQSNQLVITVGGILFVYPESAEAQSVSDCITSLLLCWAVAEKQGTSGSLKGITEDLAKVGWILSDSSENTVSSTLVSLSQSCWAGAAWSSDQREGINAVMAPKSSNQAVRDAWWKAGDKVSQAMSPPMTIASMEPSPGGAKLRLVCSQPTVPVPGVFFEASPALSLSSSNQSWTLNAELFAGVRSQLEDKVAKYRDLVVR